MSSSFPGTRLPDFSIRLRGGRQTLFRDDQPLLGHMFCSAASDPSRFQSAAEAGVEILTPFCGYEDWRGYGSCDFSRLEGAVSPVLNRNPDILFLPRFRLYAPSWWREKHPEEMPQPLVPNSEQENEPLTPSIHSEVWRREILEPLKALLDFCRREPMRGRMVGVQIGGGGLEEWRVWTDYSAPSRRAYAEWLRRRYGEDKSLRAAWRDSSVSLDEDSNLIPAPETLRAPGKLGLLRDPFEERRVGDWWEFHNYSTAEALAFFCRSAKEYAAPQKIIAGGFYAYHFWLNGLYGALQECGHAGLARLVQSEGPDYAVGLPNYDTRQPGQSAPPMGAPAYMQQNGRMYLNELDLRTHIAEGRQVTPFLSRAGDERESVSLMRREWARCVADGSLFWWFDMSGDGPGWFDDPALRREQSLAQEFGSALLSADRSSIAQCAVVSDETTTFWQAPAAEPGHEQYYQMYQHIMETIGRGGAPFESILCDGLATAGEKYRLLLFPMMAWADDARIELIDSLKCDGRTLAFCYAPGLIGPEGVSTERMERLTGMRLSVITPEKAPRYAEYQTTAFKHRLLRRVGAGRRLCSPTSLTPYVAVNDPRAIRLARNPSSDDTVIAVKELGEWRSVFIQYPFMPPGFWGDLIEYSGAHLWCEPGDTFVANASMFALHARTAGVKNIRLPQRQIVESFPEGERRIVEKTFSFETRAGETAVFRLYAH